MKKDRTATKFLDELEKIPIVAVACKAVGISRNTVYRWRKEDPDFAYEMDKSMEEGVSYINDMSEGQLISLMQEKRWPALQFWLRHHHPRYKPLVRTESLLQREIGYTNLDPEARAEIERMREQWFPKPKKVIKLSKIKKKSKKTN